ncbi:MAG: hypothetical protein SFX73_17030 [Kofleriaceae bacterium]|nr:hypothetical protein [Kofleriaceae bacterium]
MVHRFGAVFGADRVRRGLQFRDGAECPDVVSPAFWIECKRGRQTNPRAALAQASTDSAGKGLWPIAVCKDDFGDPFVVMTLEDFLELAAEWWAHRDP